MAASVERVLGGLMIVVLSSCARPAQVDTAADVAAINAVREREMAFVASGNTDSLATIYTSDVAMMPPNEPAVNGLDAVRTWAGAMLTQVTMSGSYTSSQVSVSGDWGVDRYTAVLTATPKAGGAAIEEHIKGVHIMQRGSDGTWRIAGDVWNADTPPPAPGK